MPQPGVDEAPVMMRATRPAESRGDRVIAKPIGEAEFVEVACG
jgi:hypothetical protein